MAAAIPALALALTWFSQAAAPIVLPDPPPPPGPAMADTELFGRMTERFPTVFPYSVVPGGVHSPAQLAAAIVNDPVVADHYAGIQANSVVRTRLTRYRRAHVSYRIGDHVYWTRRPVLLSPGETLLTDGVNEVRARCGNRIDDHVLGETLENEPEAGVLDTPLVIGGGELPASVITPPAGLNLGQTTNQEPVGGAPTASGGHGAPFGSGGGFGRTPNSAGPAPAPPEVPGGGPGNRSPGGPVDPENPGGPDPRDDPGDPGHPENPRAPDTPPPMPPDTPPDTPPVEPRNTRETPEPATMALLALGAGAWLAGRTKRGNV